ncbi:MAG: hypothetical protein QXJ97_13240 [Desulfurococcaceae archaeon]
MVKCPFCGFELSLEDFKKLREPWRFRFYEVRMLECPKCKGVFNYYEGFSPRGKRSSFTIKLKARSKVEAEREAGKSVEHDTVVQLLVELGEILGFHVSSEELSPDKLYRYDCVWKDASGHSPLKVFEVEFRSDVDKALARLTHAYDLWRPELYLIVADEKDLERARKLVEPRLSSAFTKIKNKLTTLSPTTLAKIHECLSREKLDEVVKQLSRR